MKNIHSQRGAVLVISLLLLVLLTLLSVSAMRSTGFQEMMVANSHEYSLSLATTETGLRDGESWIGSPTLTAKPEMEAMNSSCKDSTTSPCSSWVFTPTGVWDSTNAGQGAAFYRDSDSTWWNTNGVRYGAATGSRTVPIVANQPRYVMQELGSRNFTGSLVVDPTNTYQYYYQITARGSGRGAIATTMVQSTYGRIF